MLFEAVTGELDVEEDRALEVVAEVVKFLDWIEFEKEGVEVVEVVEMDTVLVSVIVVTLILVLEDLVLPIVGLVVTEELEVELAYIVDEVPVSEVGEEEDAEDVVEEDLKSLLVRSVEYDWSR